MPDNIRSRIHVVVFFLSLLIIFTLITCYIDIHHKKFNYYLYLIGNNIDSAGKALIKVISKDGYIAPNAEIKLNYRKIDTKLIKLRADIKDIEVTVGDDVFNFPVNYEQIVQRGRKKPQISSFAPKELKDVKQIGEGSYIGSKLVYLLPETFRMVPEYNTRVYIFCFTAEGICKDDMLTVQGNEVQLTNGKADVVVKMPPGKMIHVSFSDGFGGNVPFPYTGKMFYIEQKGSDIIVSALTDLSNIHIDCFQKQKWLFSDIVDISTKGTVLPDNYDVCDRIQASFNSQNPGTSWFVLSRENNIPFRVTDPYYFSLYSKMREFIPEYTTMLAMIYQQSHFIRLNTLYSGVDYEKVYAQDQSGTLDAIWWAIVITAFGSIFYFMIFLLRRIKIIKDEDDEHLTLTGRQQKTIVFVVITMLFLFFIMLLYLLKNLA